MHRTLAYKDLDCYHQIALPRNKDSKTIYQLFDEEPDCVIRVAECYIH